MAHSNMYGCCCCCCCCCCCPPLSVTTSESNKPPRCVTGGYSASRQAGVKLVRFCPLVKFYRSRVFRDPHATQSTERLIVVTRNIQVRFSTPAPAQSFFLWVPSTPDDGA